MRSQKRFLLFSESSRTDWEEPYDFTIKRIQEYQMEMREMRRKDRMLTDEEAYKLLKETEYGVLSTICPDGTPYGHR